MSSHIRERLLQRARLLYSRGEPLPLDLMTELMAHGVEVLHFDHHPNQPQSDFEKEKS